MVGSLVGVGMPMKIRSEKRLVLEGFKDVAQD
jgi:hypothetical protein